MKSVFAFCRPLLLLLALASAGRAQEEIVRQFLGTDADCLMNTYDVLALPGHEVELRVTLDVLPFIGNTPESEVRFRMGKTFSAAALTDESGEAVTTFTPPAPGDYVFTVDVAPNEAFDVLPRPMELRVACRRADTPIIIIDLDDTVVTTNVLRLVAGAARPVAGSRDALQRLAKDYTVVYLTFRPDTLGLRSKAWLRRCRYPAGPLLMPAAVDLFRGSGGFKTRKLRELTDSFNNIAIGVGDKISDVQAYEDNRLTGFLLLHYRHYKDSEDYFDLVEDLDRLHKNTHVVYSWREILDVIYEGKSFPRSAAQQALRATAKALKAQEDLEEREEEEQKRRKREKERRKRQRDRDEDDDEDDDD